MHGEYAGLHVWLIEDDPTQALLLSRTVTALMDGGEVRHFDNGRDALQNLTISPAPELLLLDIHLPEISGLEILAHLKADRRWATIPVVMLTASESRADIARAYELGAGGYITKSSLRHDLRAIMGNTLLYWSAMRRTPEIPSVAH